MNNTQREYTITQIKKMDSDIKRLRVYAVKDALMIGITAVHFASSIFQGNIDDFKDFPVATNFLIGNSVLCWYTMISELTKIAGINTSKLNLEHMLKMDELDSSQFEGGRHL